MLVCVSARGCTETDFSNAVSVVPILNFLELCLIAYFWNTTFGILFEFFISVWCILCIVLYINRTQIANITHSKEGLEEAATWTGTKWSVQIGQNIPSKKLQLFSVSKQHETDNIFFLHLISSRLFPIICFFNTV